MTDGRIGKLLFALNDLFKDAATLDELQLRHNRVQHAVQMAARKRVLCLMKENGHGDFAEVVEDNVVEPSADTSAVVETSVDADQKTDSVD